MKQSVIAIVIATLFFVAGRASTAASDNAPRSLPQGPEAGGRTYAQNYRDMILASCVARAYKDDPKASKDAGFSAGVFVEWTQYDVERSGKAIDQLINGYLARDYRNPMPEYSGVDFDLLKCFDMYHSRELDEQVKHYVIKPSHTYRQDYPSH